MKKISITVDTSFEDILQFDENGENLTFDYVNFKKLTDEEIEQLSRTAKTSYFVGYGMYLREKEIQSSPPTEGLNITGQYASATSRLDVIYPPGWKDKFHPVWKRADEVNSATRSGYVRVGTTGEDAGVQSFSPNHTVGTSRETELVLMKEPVEQNEKRVSVPQNASKSRVDNYEEGTKEAIREAGGLVYEPPGGAKEDGKNWSSYRGD